MIQYFVKKLWRRVIKGKPTKSTIIDPKRKTNNDDSTVNVEKSIYIVLNFRKKKLLEESMTSEDARDKIVQKLL